MATKIVRALFAAAACTIFMIATPVALWLAVGFLVLLGLFLRMLRLRRRVPALLLALVLLLPNLRWGASILALRLKEREPLQASCPALTRQGIVVPRRSNCVEGGVHESWPEAGTAEEHVAFVRSTAPESGAVFYKLLQQFLHEEEFDSFPEKLCAPFYAP